MTRPRLDALVPLGVALLAGVAAQAPRPAPAQAPVKAGQMTPEYVASRLAEWRTAVRSHAGGQFDGPATAIARWPPDQTRAVVHLAIRVREQRRAREEIDDDKADIAKGLVLHTDIAIAERTRETGTAGGAHTSRLLDARMLAPMALSIHWGLGTRLAEALAKDPVEAPIARAWSRAVAALYQQWADLGQLQYHLAADDGLVAGDAVLQLYRGTLHQAYADARLQTHLAPFRAPHSVFPGRSGPIRGIDEADQELRVAEHAFRRALAIEPTLGEARVRLAHVLLARDKPAEAAALAREALAAPLPTFVEYYATMVLGHAEARLDRGAEARAAFERAVALYPRSQAAQVALSHVRLDAGQAADAVAAVLEALGPDAPAGVDDPWSWYFRLHEPDAQSRLVEFRGSVK